MAKRCKILGNELYDSRPVGSVWRKISIEESYMSMIGNIRKQTIKLTNS